MHSVPGKSTLMKVLFLLIVSITSILHAEENATEERNGTVVENNLSSIESAGQLEEQHKAAQTKQRLLELNEKLEELNAALKKDLWYTRYNNHLTYLEIKHALEETKKELAAPGAQMDKHHFQELTKTEKALKNQLDLLQDFNAPPFEELTKPKDIEEPPTIGSPFDIINGFTYLKLLKNKKEKYNAHMGAFKGMIERLRKKERILKQIVTLDPSPYNLKRLKTLQKEIDEISSTYDIAAVTNRIFNKKLDDISLKVTDDIKVQMKRLFNIAIIVLVIILLSFLMKFIAKKTISDNERYYMANKIINFSNFTLIILVLLFSFLENVTYLVTVLGFASAGIAIAMKDLFMSILGWLVIVFGGSFHVGDRVKAVKNGVEYVGDIVDISLLKMTILEDITLTTYMHNRRAGRVIFIPNNYIFTELLANYTHGKIKTVWDGIDITVTFDSNHKKAVHLIKEIVKKYSKGYTDISRKQLNKLRSQYSLKNINVDPRIYTFAEPNGIRISCWYMTNSYATLTLRSNIFANIIDMINQEEDIAIAYPTQVVNIKRDTNIPISPEKESGETRIS